MTVSMATYKLRKYWKARNNPEMLYYWRSQKVLSTFLASVVEIGPNIKFLFNYLSFFANNMEEPGLKCSEI